MYSKDEIQKTRQAFWTAFGQYMLPVLSAEGEKVNWINYKTGIKNIRFTMNADNQSAFIGIVIRHASNEKHHIYFEHLVANKKILEENVGEVWEWQENSDDENGVAESRIYTTIENVSVMKRENWPAIIAFLKPRIIALDAFWSQARYGFEDL